MASREFDAIVLGAGPAGEVCAGRLADAGLAVALAESHLVGGECSFYACMPSKALLRPAEALAEATRVAGATEAAEGEIDRGAVLDRRDDVIHGLDDCAQIPWLQKQGIELLRGEAWLEAERRVRIGGEAFMARQVVVIATGSGSAIPPIEGLDAVAAWSNREATTAERVPASLIVLGGGPVGCELAQAWASLGSRVTLIEAEERLLCREEPFAGEQVAAALSRCHGVDVRLGARVTRVRGEPGTGVRAEIEGGPAATGAEILLAVGRRPRTRGIGLEEIGVRTDERGFLAVDSRMRVDGRHWLYGVGDVNGRSLLTHSGKYQAWVAAENILGRPAAAVAEGMGSPRVTFTDPQVAAVGRTLAQAREAGLDATAVEVATDSTAGASFHGRETGGTSQLVIDRTAATLVGATFTGFETAELLHAATIAIVAAVPLSRLRHAIPAFPTRSEVWLRLAETYERSLDD